MVTGTLYSYPGSYRAYQILIAAGYSGADVKVDPKFEFGKTNATDGFLKKFPFGKVPAFEDSNGNVLTETSAIASYVANETLRGGKNPIDQALVQQYISFAENEIVPSACTWTFPTLGFRHFNKQDTEKAMSHLKKCFKLLDDLLSTRTFFVGERVTLADISLCCSLILLYVQVLDPHFRAPYCNVNRWFVTCINQPIFKKILGEITLCSKMASFDPKKFNELHPKQGKQEKPKAEKKQEPKKEVKKPEDDAAEKTEKPNRKDYFADVPKSEFVLDDWKKMYANNPITESFPYLWKNFDPNAYSIWRFSYKYPNDCHLSFLAKNLLTGFFQRVEGLRKHSHCVAAVYKVVIHVVNKDDQELIVAKGTPGATEKSCHTIDGCWLFKGTSLIFERCEDWQLDYPHFTWQKLDTAKEDDRQFTEWCLSLDEDLPNAKFRRDNGKYIAFNEIR